MDDNRNAPATKGDIADVKAELKGDIADVKAELKGDIAAVNGSVADVLEAVRDVETKLLGAFYSYAKTNDKRLLEAEGNETLLRSRLATLETRVTDIEERLNTPPRP